MRKCSIILVLLFVLGISGCSSNKILGVRDNVDAFYQAYYDADINEMYKYISDTMESPTLDFYKEKYEKDASLILDLTNDFSYKIESVEMSDGVAYVSIEFECHDVFPLMDQDEANGYDHSQQDLEDKKSLFETWERIKILADNCADYQKKSTKRIKMIKKNNKWCFDDNEENVFAPDYMFMGG